MVEPTKRRRILQAPNLILEQVSKPVYNVDAYIKELAEEMLSIVGGVTRVPSLGLAAVQLGEPVRMIVILYNMYSREFRRPALIINPEIVKRSDHVVNSNESCLSIGHGKQSFTVKRHKQVKVIGIDLQGGRVVYKERALPGVALQHEIDHLDGKLISDV